MKLMRLLLVIAMMLPCALLAGCAATVIRSGASSCLVLIPTEWVQGVAPADLPDTAVLDDGHDDAAPWQKGFVAQTGRLEISNERFLTAYGIVDRCEKRDQERDQRAGKKWYQFWR
jgi:hypothetical protein